MSLIDCHRATQVGARLLAAIGAAARVGAAIRRIVTEARCRYPVERSRDGRKEQHPYAPASPSPIFALATLVAPRLVPQGGTAQP